jgi:hypothetical protein
MKKITLFSAAAALMLAGSSLKAQVPAQANPTQTVLLDKVTANPGEMKISYEKYKLPNGLTLIVHEDHSDPIVHVEVTYHVGSARETPGKSGFAHFFEHMMFQGSMHVKDEIKRANGNGYESTILGKGVQQVKEIIDEGLKNGGTIHFIVEQEAYQGIPPLDCIKEDLKVMKQWGYK